MPLSDRDIRAELDSGRVRLTPYDPAMVQPASVDVRIDRFFRVFDNHKYAMIDPAEEQAELTREIAVDPDEKYMRTRGSSCSPRPTSRSPCPTTSPRASRARARWAAWGQATHSTAGFIDPGFTGHITLELSNVATLPVALWPGMKIGQLCFFRLSSPAQTPYGTGANNNRYLGQRGPTASRSYLNFHRTRIEVDPEGDAAL